MISTSSAPTRTRTPAATASMGLEPASPAPIARSHTLRNQRPTTDILNGTPSPQGGIDADEAAAQLPLGDIRTAENLRYGTEQMIDLLEGRFPPRR